MEIYYNGLVGSRLWGNEEECSDEDYIVIAKNAEFPFQKKDGKDFFFIEPKVFIDYVFDTPTKEVTGIDNYPRIIDWVFSTPVEENDFSQWLIDNREAIVECNKNYWYHISTEHANFFDTKRKADYDELFYLITPKDMAKAYIRLRPALRYPVLGNWKEAMLLTETEKEFLAKLRRTKISNLELLDVISQDLELIRDNESFWKTEQDKDRHELLKAQALTFFK